MGRHPAKNSSLDRDMYQFINMIANKNDDEERCCEASFFIFAVDFA